MKTLALATIAVAVLALNMPANAPMRVPSHAKSCQFQYPTLLDGLLARQLNGAAGTNTQIRCQRPLG
jgi:hypothetical protein